MQAWILQWLSFTRPERRAILMLCTMILVAYVFRFLPQDQKIHPRYNLAELVSISDTLLYINKKEKEAYNAKSTFDYKQKAYPKYKKKNNYEKEYASNYENYNFDKKKYKSTYKSKKEKKSKPKRQVFIFDPNTINRDSLENLGFKNYVIDNWLKLRTTGKKYYQKEDLLSVYGIDTSLVMSLDNFIKYPEKPTPIIKRDEKKEIPIVDINTIDKEGLQAIPGIGPSYATRILKYRDIIGGYHSIDQLESVYGMPDSVIQKIKPYLQFSETLEKIKINIASKQELADNYHFNYKEAKIIVAYRNQHGPFENQEQFEKLMGISSAKKQSIVPYLDFSL